MLGQNRFGMELHADGGILPVTQAHHLAFRRASAHFQAVRQRLGDDERMVASGRQRRRQSAEDALPVVDHRRHFAVHQSPGPHHPPAKGLADGLMPQADAQNRQAGSKALDQGQRDAGVVGRAGAG